MALTFTPGQLRQRGEFYYQLAQLTSAGIGLPQAFDQLARNPPAHSYRQPLGQLLKLLQEGHTLADSLERLRPWLPDFDMALLHAGELSGRLDACFRVLGNYYNDRARLARQLVGDLVYPAFLLHFAVFILPFAQWFSSGNTLAYLMQTFGVLLPLYGVLFVMIYAAQGRHGEAWRGRFEALLDPVPVLGSARRDLALGRLAEALEALLAAGVTIIEAWELAATASGSPALRSTVRAWRPQVDGGRTPAEVVSESRRFPELFANQYAAGEMSGKLEETLGRLHQYYQEDGTRKLQAVAQWTPRAIYLGVMLMIAWRVIQFWSNHFKDIGAAGF